MRRTNLPDGFYHVTGRATGGSMLFRCGLDRYDFNGLVSLAIARFEWRMYARCLMGTHFHLLMAATREHLSAGMYLVAGTHTKRFNKRHLRRGCLFEGRSLGHPDRGRGPLQHGARVLPPEPRRGGSVHAGRGLAVDRGRGSIERPGRP